MSEFKITMNKGFHMTFENGLTISVQFGPYNYCDNRYADCGKSIGSSRTAEIAIWDTDGKWITKQFFPNLNDDVKGYMTTDEVAQLIERVVNYKEPAPDNRDGEIRMLLGKTITKIDRSDDELVFHTDTGDIYRMYHHQDCCESVTIDDITGDLDNLIGSPIVYAEAVSNQNDPPGFTPSMYRDSYTWTFYKLATINGWVDIRWYGESNGYYSESVSFEKI